jgi:hypothetical protein
LIGAQITDCRTEIAGEGSRGAATPGRSKRWRSRIACPRASGRASCGFSSATRLLAGRHRARHVVEIAQPTASPRSATRRRKYLSPRIAGDLWVSAPIWGVGGTRLICLKTGAFRRPIGRRATSLQAGGHRFHHGWLHSTKDPALAFSWRASPRHRDRLRHSSTRRQVRGDNHSRRRATA